MKIVFVTPGYNPQDVRRGSGTFYYLAQELERQGCILFYVGPLEIKDPPPTRFFRWLAQKIFKGRYLTYLDPWIAQARGKLLAEQLATFEYDFILTNDHGIAAENKTGKRVIVYTDVMLPPVYKRSAYMPFTPFYNLPSLFVSFFQSTIKKSLERSNLLVFPAKWQSDIASRYGIFPGKIKVIPFGANIPDPKEAFLDKELDPGNKRLDILLVGKNWKGKGGDLAVKVVEQLRKTGLEAILHVVGLELNSMPAYIKSYGLLDKNNPADWARMDELYRAAHVFIFPSLSEGSAIAPREASAYGLPTLAYRIDGLVGSVEHGINGILFDPSADETAFANQIREWMEHPEQYKQISRSARKFYEANANWARTVGQLIKLLNEFLF